MALIINLPITEDWWIPHLFYTQWQNLSILQIANFLGIYGIELLRNYKTHKAPGEKISVLKGINNFIEINNTKITSDVCYDLHYPDLENRAKGKDLLFAPVDDDRFGKFLPYLHARDVIFRAIENRINILTASTNGPTFFVNKYGIIKKGPLKIYEEGFLIVETDI